MRIARAALETATWIGDDGDGWRAISDPWVAFAEGRDPEFHGDVIAEPSLLAPCSPLTVVGMAQNGRDAPLPIQAWLKSPRTVVPSGTPVRLRRDAGKQVAEAEIAIVIGRDASNVSVADAASVILGVTAVNDLSSPDRAAIDVRNFEAKAGVGFTPLGPWIDTSVDIESLSYSLDIDGATVAATTASALPGSIAECIAYVTSWVPLGPGDIIMTGAPFSAGVVEPGQTMTVRVGDMTLVTPTH